MPFYIPPGNQFIASITNHGDDKASGMLMMLRIHHRIPLLFPPFISRHISRTWMIRTNIQIYIKVSDSSAEIISEPVLKSAKTPAKPITSPASAISQASLSFSFIDSSLPGILLKQIEYAPVRTSMTDELHS